MSLPDVLPEQGELAERYRALRAAVEATWERDTPGRTLLVAGVEQSVAMVGTQLAVAFARSGQPTRLIDTDLRTPQCQHLLGIQDRMLPGLATWLRDAGTVPVIETTIPNLTLVPAGQNAEQSVDLMSGERLAALASWLQAEPGRSVIVAPPLASRGEALPFVRHVDGVLLVMVPGRTARPAAMRARDAILGGGGRLLGVVLGDPDTLK